jgi:hypothetical protein
VWQIRSVRAQKNSVRELTDYTYDGHRKLAFSILAHDTWGITPLAAGVATKLRTSAKNSVRGLTDYTHDGHRKLAFSTLAHDTWEITPLAAGVATTLRTSAKFQSENLLTTHTMDTESRLSVHQPMIP